MNRDIIDVPLPFASMLDVNWMVDWRGQSAGTSTAGTEQVVYNRFPRWVGSPTMAIFPEMIGDWRALVAKAQGRVNAWRFRMVDPALIPFTGRDYRAWRSGLYVEPRPQVTCTAAVVAGASTITIDEREAARPIPVGAILSYSDWPFLVQGRSGAGASVALSVTMLRTAIPADGKIDLIARGVFLAASDTMGWPAYDASHLARPKLDLMEWITR